MRYDLIKSNVREIIELLPPGVDLVAAAKTRTPDEVMAAVEAGTRIVGENYVQEALAVMDVIPPGVSLHLIGHLQKNKVKKAVKVFDLIETVDSLGTAEEIDRRSQDISKVMPVLIEVNSGREPQKHGVFPEDVETLIRSVSELKNIRVRGLMTMGPLSPDPSRVRGAFRETKEIFDRISRIDIPGVEMVCLSMGMSDSYKVAIEEGANMVRIGTGIFGNR